MSTIATETLPANSQHLNWREAWTLARMHHRLTPYRGYALDIPEGRLINHPTEGFVLIPHAQKLKQD